MTTPMTGLIRIAAVAPVAASTGATTKHADAGILKSLVVAELSRGNFAHSAGVVETAISDLSGNGFGSGGSISTHSSRAFTPCRVMRWPLKRSRAERITRGVRQTS